MQLNKIILRCRDWNKDFFKVSFSCTWILKKGKGQLSSFSVLQSEIYNDNITVHAELELRQATLSFRKDWMDIV